MRLRSFIIKTLREVLSKTLNQNVQSFNPDINKKFEIPLTQTFFNSNHNVFNSYAKNFVASHNIPQENVQQQEVRVAQNVESNESEFDLPLGRVIGQLGNKYILAENVNGFVIIDQHAAHERITYEKLRKHEIKTQPLLTSLTTTRLIIPSIFSKVGCFRHLLP